MYDDKTIITKDFIVFLIPKSKSSITTLCETHSHFFQPRRCIIDSTILNYIALFEVQDRKILKYLLISDISIKNNVIIMNSWTIPRLTGPNLPRIGRNGGRGGDLCSALEHQSGGKIVIILIVNKIHKVSLDMRKRS